MAREEQKVGFTAHLLGTGRVFDIPRAIPFLKLVKNVGVDVRNLGAVDLNQEVEYVEYLLMHIEGRNAYYKTEEMLNATGRALVEVDPVSKQLVDYTPPVREEETVPEETGGTDEPQTRG